MTTLISTSSISYDLTSCRLFDGLSFTIKKGDRIGLIGSNGCGKSTLLRLLNKDLPDYVGSVSFASYAEVALIEQHLPKRLLTMSMLDAVVDNLPPEIQLSEQWRAQIILSNLGFDESYWDQPIGTLSGGQYARVLVARALIVEPDVLLLDEPSNHLDLPTLLWLEQFLMDWKGTFVMVSHDQRLLDHVTNCTWVLRDKKLQTFSQTCTQARKALEEKDRADAERQEAEQKEINRIEKSAQRLAIWGRDFDNEGLARKAKSMEKRAAGLRTTMTRLDTIEPWTLSLSGESMKANRLLELASVPIAAAQDQAPLFEVLFQQIKSGDRVAILGKNGAGKSSLLKVLWASYQASQLEDNGYFHPQAEVGYYDQSLNQLCDEHSLIDSLYPFYPVSQEARKMALISAGFSYERHDQKIAELSGGERSRLLFVGLSLAKYHFLLLDEPTNHLDIEGKEELVNCLTQFEGGLLLVSHDRELIEKSCNRFWYINDGQLVEMTYLDAVYEAMSVGNQVVSLEANDTAPSSVLLSKSEFIENHHSNTTQNDEELLLERLLELEELLTQDQSRKAKHQKPDLQHKWQQEIETINMKLELR
ncbi:ABC-F family ATP-binding cassette domain-containing protein [Vibrio crassostreae]|uniref:ABC-F family ATP-binding cassette domain-containing protein n=1 Tax=Vibrio crassostreae TaxID=246167 RepID=UPI0006377924|nr:ABC-F family ATP-binding cassette domain-containing protein [Vibrio crassostreae]TCO04778.1 ATPase subunit of ABC transporter with duplicated ATPase domains [Vibrio crassostreae]TCT71305.1 ATPase subunit of ABC transporter with duplicated ATPase domains [Vibrio crassostreae]CAK1842291.1 ABC-F family ATP-binding cassette domain-containing protein [Vibrio crassostreae]CAK1856821.1 ABC-F family ATP-binding cassette domain-containing protein [Vibrio crassostreae]CAK1867096.1 ABC-F family ATP-bi